MKNIYQIGFNKTATISLKMFFELNGIPSVYYDHGNLSRTIQDNYKNNTPLFKGYEQLHSFFDMEHFEIGSEIVFTAEKLFEEMYANDQDGFLY